MRKFLPGLALVFSLALAGCGGDNDPSFSAGDPSTCEVGSVSLTMRYMPGGKSFPTGTGDDGTGTISGAYWIAETEVTYALWNSVYDWAENGNGPEGTGKGQYSFTNAGSQGGFNDSGTVGTFSAGHDTDPVTTINWYDAIVWCNALTEYCNAAHGGGLQCVYKDANHQPLRDATDTATCNGVTPDMQAEGFRLPTSLEWECAARYIGAAQPTVDPLRTEAILENGIYWAPGTYASGATANYENFAATGLAAWCWGNSNPSDIAIHSTQPVGHKDPNGLGVYDMSGNAWELTDSIYSGNDRVARGGSWNAGSIFTEIGYKYEAALSSAENDLGFRPVRTE